MSLSKVAVRPNELWVGYRTYRLVPDQISSIKSLYFQSKPIQLYSDLPMSVHEYEYGRRGLEGNLISRT